MALIRKLGVIVGILDEMIGASAKAALQRDGAPDDLVEALDAKLGRKAKLDAEGAAPLDAAARDHHDVRQSKPRKKNQAASRT